MSAWGVTITDIKTPMLISHAVDQLQRACFNLNMSLDPINYRYYSYTIAVTGLPVFYWSHRGNRVLIIFAKDQPIFGADDLLELTGY